MKKDNHPNTARGEFLRGFKAEMPILIGAIPFGLIYGAAAINAGIPPLAAQAMSLIVFGGSAQVIMTKLIGSGAPVFVTIATGFVVNLRHVLYSASIAPYFKHLNPLWKWFLPYLLTDEAYAVAISHYQQEGDIALKHWYFLGAGLALGLTWQISTAIGILVGTQVPASWSLDFTIALTFIAIVVPIITDRAMLLAACTASGVAIALSGMPYKLDLMVATFVGMVVALAIPTQKGHS